MSIRHWNARIFIATILLCLGFALPAGAQVDPGANPSLLSITEPEELRALGVCLSDPALSAEIYDCFQFGSLRGMGFTHLVTRFGIQLYAGSLVFGDNQAAVRLDFFFVDSVSFGSQISFAVSPVGSVPPTVVAATADDFNFLSWLVTDGVGNIAEFVSSEGWCGVQITSDPTARFPRYTALISGGIHDFSSLQLFQGVRELSVSAAYSATTGYFDVDTN